MPRAANTGTTTYHPVNTFLRMEKKPITLLSNAGGRILELWLLKKFLWD